jgi:hypothetical protein
VKKDLQLLACLAFVYFLDALNLLRAGIWSSAPEVLSANMAESVEQAAILQVMCKRRAKRTTALPTARI